MNLQQTRIVDKEQSALHIASSGSLLMISQQPISGLYAADRKKAVVSREEIIAYGGIQEVEQEGFRSSERIRSQPNADATQLDRAIQLAQRRDSPSFPGYSKSYTLDSYVVLSSTRGPAAAYGYWMHPVGDTRFGFLQSGWVAAC